MASHTEPLNLVTVRIVDKNSPQLIDALISKKGIPGKTFFKIAALVRDISPEGQSDRNLWELLISLISKEPKRGDFITGFENFGF